MWIFHFSDYPTSMISPCQEGKSSPDALGRSANKSLQVSPARLRASRRWFLLDREPDIHLLSRPRRASQKIELVISCQSRNNSMGASGASVAQSATDETRQAAR